MYGRRGSALNELGEGKRACGFRGCEELALEATSAFAQNLCWEQDLTCIYS
jgi:hypothetical protein